MRVMRIKDLSVNWAESQNKAVLLGQLGYVIEDGYTGRLYLY